MKREEFIKLLAMNNPTVENIQKEFNVANRRASEMRFLRNNHQTAVEVVANDYFLPGVCKFNYLNQYFSNIIRYQRC